MTTSSGDLVRMFLRPFRTTPAIVAEKKMCLTERTKESSIGRGGGENRGLPRGVCWHETRYKGENNAID